MTPAAGHPLTLNLVHHATPGDNSGITREDDTEGTGCGITNFTRPTATLAAFNPDAEVIVKDAAGVILAKASLGSGVATDIKPSPANRYTCTWAVEIRSVAASDFYTVFVGDQAVGNLARTELEATNWTATVPVGDR